MKPERCGRRIGAVAGLTVRETVRQGTLPAALGVAAVTALLAWALGAVGSDGPGGGAFAVSFGLGAQAFLGLALALILAVDVMHGDTAERRADLLLSRDLTRLEWLLGRWLGLAVLVVLFCGSIAGITAGILTVQSAPEAGAPRFAAVTAASGLLVLRGVWTAAVVAGLAAFVRGRLLLMLAGAGVVMAGQGRELLEDSLRRILGPVWADAGSLVVRILPDLTRWDLSSELERGLVDPGVPIQLMVVAGGSVGLAVAAAALAWTCREGWSPERRVPGVWAQRGLGAAAALALAAAGVALDDVTPGRSAARAKGSDERQGAEALLSCLGGYRATAANLAWLRAQVAVERADPKATGRHLEAAIRLAPDRLHFRIHGARLLAYDLAATVPGRRDDLRRAAREWLRRAEAEHPDWAEIPVEAGLLALRTGDPGEEAIRAFGRAARLPNAPEYAGRIEADLLGRAGRWAEARQAWLREFARLEASRTVPTQPDPLGWTQGERLRAIALRIEDLERLMETPREKRFRWPQDRDGVTLDLSEG